MSSHLTKVYQELVNHFGTQEQAANAIGIKQPSINALVSGKVKMTADVAMRAEEATNGKFKAIDLCPTLKKFAEQQQMTCS